MSIDSPEQPAVSIAAAPASSRDAHRPSAFAPEAAGSRGTRGSRGGADLRHLIARGVLWTGAGTVARQVLQLATSLVLARLLTPDLFGVVGMAAVFVGIAEIFVDFGLRQAIIQARQPTPALLSSCFWLSAGIGLLTALLLCALAPVIAALYQEPRITPLLPFLGINLLRDALDGAEGAAAAGYAFRCADPDVVRRGTDRRNNQLRDGGVGLRRVEPGRAAADEQSCGYDHDLCRVPLASRFGVFRRRPAWRGALWRRRLRRGVAQLCARNADNFLIGRFSTPPRSAITVSHTG